MTDPDKRGVITFSVGSDFSVDDLDKWRALIAFWLTKSQKNLEEDPMVKAERILQAAVNGTKLNGEIWAGVENFSLRTRIKQLCGFDIVTQKGRLYRPASTRIDSHPKKRESKKVMRANGEVIDAHLDMTVEKLNAYKDDYIQLLYQEFPFVENPVYEAQVNGLAEAVVKLNHISDRFMAAQGKELEDLLKIRDGLKKDMDDFMKLLKIHPSQIKEKSDDIDKGDVGNLIVAWEKYGEVAEIYEKVDAIQELIQTIRQLEQTRVDGSPQLADYLLWHKTGTRPIEFKCECGKEYTLFDGFTEEELYEAAEQAYKAFGFGIRKLDEESETKETTEATA